MSRFRRRRIERREYADRDVRLADLVEWDRPIVRNAIFRNCHIMGPALIAPDSGTKFTNCGFKFEESAEELLWEVPPHSVKSGCVAVEDCLFDKCTFSSVGIAGGPKIIDRFRKLDKAD